MVPKAQTGAERNVSGGRTSEWSECLGRRESKAVGVRSKAGRDKKSLAKDTVLRSIRDVGKWVSLYRID